MRISDPSQLAPGMEIFCTDGFTAGAYDCVLTKVEVVEVSVSSGTKPAGPKTWIRVKSLALHDDITSLRLIAAVWEECDSCKDFLGKEHLNSMQDMGIIQNHYNKHQVFTTLEDAKLYGEGKLELSDFDTAPDVSIVGDYERAMKVI